MDSTELGNIGEAAAKMYFLKQGYEVYDGDGYSYYDFIIYDKKKHEAKTVEVKTTKTRNDSDSGWMVRCKKKEGRYGKDIPFDNVNTDYLVIYIEPLDRVIVKSGRGLDVKYRFSVFDKDLES